MLSEKFIYATPEYSTYKNFVASPFMRKAFVIQNESEKAKVTIGCAGFYDVYINGKRITKGMLAPYISNSDHIVYYDEYDICQYLQPGKNVLGIQLGNGMQNSVGGEIWDFDKAPFRGAPRVAFSIEITDKNGREYFFESDTSVKCAPSPVIFDDLRCGCFYDGRNENIAWANVDFDDSTWANVLRAETPRGEKRICEADPIVPVRALKPVSVRKCKMAPFRNDKRTCADTSKFPSKEREGWRYNLSRNRTA